MTGLLRPIGYWQRIVSVNGLWGGIKVTDLQLFYAVCISAPVVALVVMAALLVAIDVTTAIIDWIKGE